jgi:hypothetical protein
MSATDEQELRDRLHQALDGVTPAGPPARAIVGRGRGIRRRRWIGAGAALAAVIVVGATAPGLIAAVAPAPAAAPHYRVTVNPPRPGVRGLIGSGTINGKPWRVSLMGSGQNITAFGPGLPYAATAPATPQKGGDPVGFSSFTGQVAALYGSLRADVTVVAMRLADGSLLTLRPVAYRGARWVAVALPPQARITNIIAYGRGGELAHAVPYHGSEISNDVVSWLRPGQPGRRRATVTVASGTAAGQQWTATATVGPWGLCLTGPGGVDCFETQAGLPPVSGQAAAIAGCNPLTQAAFYDGSALGSVRSLRLKLSDGSTRRLRPVPLAGTRFFAYTIAKGVRVVRWRAYDAAGRQVGTGTTDWNYC